MVTITPPSWEHPKWRFPRHYRPLRRESFDHFKRTKKGDKSKEALYESIGRAVTQWSMIDTAVCRLYSALILPGQRRDMPQLQAVENSLGPIISTQTKLKVIKEAMHSRQLPRTLDKRLNEHLKILDAAAIRRNEIAHGIVSHIKGYGFILSPHIRNTGKINKNPDYTNRHGLHPVLDPLWKFRFRSRDINRYSDRFTYLFCETWNLAVDVSDELDALHKERLERSARSTRRARRQEIEDDGA